jgi:hypothetical protein
MKTQDTVPVSVDDDVSRKNESGMRGTIINGFREQLPSIKVTPFPVNNRTLSSTRLSAIQRFNSPEKPDFIIQLRFSDAVVHLIIRSFLPGLAGCYRVLFLIAQMKNRISGIISSGWGPILCTISKDAVFPT